MLGLNTTQASTATVERSGDDLKSRKAVTRLAVRKNGSVWRRRTSAVFVAAESGSMDIRGARTVPCQYPSSVEVTNLGGSRGYQRIATGTSSPP